MSVQTMVLKFWRPAYFGVLILFTASAVFLWISSQIQSPRASLTKAAIDTACVKSLAVVDVSITDAAFMPSSVTAHRCDIIVFHNDTNALIDVAMGPHDEHFPYPGLSDGVIESHKSKPLLLVLSGTFPLHEHLQDAAVGSLTILP